MNTPVSTPQGYSHRAIGAIALPMILSAISIPMAGIVDTGVMGHLDSPLYLAAVAASATIFSFVFMGFNFLRMGTTGVTAQAFGSGDAERIGESLVQPLIIAVCISCALLLLQVPLRELALWVLGPGEATKELARVYFDIRIWSAPFILSNFVIVGWLLGMQNARGPLVIILTFTLSNIALDLWFVIGLGMTVDGVALASLIAEIEAFVVGIVFVRAELRDIKPAWRLDHYRELGRYLPLFRINGNLFIRSMALMGTLGFITAQGARLGDLILATNALLMNFVFVSAYALDGIAHAAEALAGKAVGARDLAGLRLAVRRSLLWTGVFATLFTLVYLAGGTQFIDLLTDIPDIRATARIYLPWLIASPLIAAWCYFYDGVYVGVTRAREMRIVMVGSALLIFLPVWFVFRDWGNHALWLALMAFMASRGIAMHLWYRRLFAAGSLIR
jgi:MATE family multidrug resistance protein